jgi:MFS family permease
VLSTGLDHILKRLWSLWDSGLAKVPRGIWAIGFVSMFMDISSEMIHALLPLYMVNVLGASALAVGFIEGIAEATANITKIFSGALSDWLGKRKLLAVIGYGLAAITKPVFPLAPTLTWIVAARFVDRIGKGIRGAPRDALVADIAPPELRATSFGLRQSLDTVGAFIGPLLAIGLLLISDNNFRTVFWIAVIPAFIAVALMIFAVQEPLHKPKHVTARRFFSSTKQLTFSFWFVMVLAFALTLARFSEAFLVLRAQNLGLALTLIPLTLVFMNIVYAAASTPAGIWADRFGKHHIFTAGITCLIIADVILAYATNVFILMVGILFWGLHMGLTQSLLSAHVADTAPSHLRGTAFGILNLVMGVAMLLASIIAGKLWDSYSPTATFLAGAGFAAVALVGFLFSTAIRKTE